MIPPTKCLLVDDLEDNLLALSAVLAGDDVQIFTARSGTEALELALEHDFALAFLDVQMPLMDGFELAELMRGAERTRHVPLIFVTAGARDQHRLFKGYESGAVDFLYKPIEPHVARSKSRVFFELYRQRQQLAAELRERTETLRLSEMFCAVLGHDLRNPLAAILASAYLVQHKADDPALKAAAERIVAGSKWMSRLIGDMLDLARARLAGGIPLRLAAVDLSALARQVLREQFGPQEQRLRLACAGDAQGHWDGDRLTQVIANLVGNALQHGVAGEPVLLAIDGCAAERVTLSVRNAGCIDAALLPQLFDPFRAGGPAAAGGLGLGLYIVRQLALQHGGDIAARCEDGTHTVFELTLPRRSFAAALPVVAAATPSGLSSPAGAGEHQATAARHGGKPNEPATERDAKSRVGNSC